MLVFRRCYALARSSTVANMLPSTSERTSQALDQRKQQGLHMGAAEAVSSAGCVLVEHWRHSVSAGHQQGRARGVLEV